MCHASISNYKKLFVKGNRVTKRYVLKKKKITYNAVHYHSRRHIRLLPTLFRSNFQNEFRDTALTNSSALQKLLFLVRTGMYALLEEKKDTTRTRQ